MTKRTPTDKVAVRRRPRKPGEAGRDHEVGGPLLMGLLAASVRLGQWVTIVWLSLLAASAAERWLPTWESLDQHQVPSWLLDAKIGIQFVGPRQNFTDEEWAKWNRQEDRRRRLRGTESPGEDIAATIAAHHRVGARFLVSMMAGAYPGTEGLLMTDREVAAARAVGLRVGIHYNLLRRNEIPQAGDPGYVAWYQDALKAEIERISADFLFFDGALEPEAAFRTREIVAWYYNWAERRQRPVWVNDDLGSEFTEFGAVQHGDIVDMETETYDAVAPRPWINWDILRNEWNCWINEYGIHRRTGVAWQWRYRDAGELLHGFIDLVSKGGIWLVQMENTAAAWRIMDEIGAWLEVNGEAIYGTRPLLPPRADAARVPPKGSFKYYSGDNRNFEVWTWKWQQILAEARRSGPVYYTRKGEVIYVLHWGDPGRNLELDLPVDITLGEVALLGHSGPLEFTQTGRKVSVRLPENLSVSRACAFRFRPSRWPAATPPQP